MDKVDFKNLRKNTEECKRVVRPLQKHWDESWVEYVKRARKESRELLLLRLLPKRVCPSCGSTKLKSRQWVIVDRVHGPVVCRSCYHRGLIPEQGTTNARNIDTNMK